MKQDVVEIDGMKITITELKVKTARKVLSNVIELFQNDINVEALLNDKYDLLVDIASEFVIMPEGMSIDDLSYGDIKNKLFPVFKEVNESFLDDIMGFMPVMNPLLDQDDPMNLSSEDSTTQLQD